MAAPDKNTLEYYLVQLRRIAEHREAGAEQEIHRLYDELVRELQRFLGEEYARLAEDDRLTYGILHRQGAFARFLEEVTRRIDTTTWEASSIVEKLVEETYRNAYTGMVTAVENAKTSAELHEALRGVRTVTPEIIQRMVENPLSGLTLKDTLERNRQQVIYNIKQQIGVGLSQGDRMSTMAQRISQQVDGDYRKAMTISRTEVHRVREAGYHDSAAAVSSAINDANIGVVMTKTWRTMRDEAVRPQRRVRGGKKRTARVYIGGANHVKMEGVTVRVEEQFDLGGGVKTDAPGQSGVAEQDINCRCYLSYDLLTAAEYAAKTGWLQAGEERGTIKKSGLYRREQNVGAFADLEIPMQKRAVVATAKKFGIDTSGITFKIQRAEELLSKPYYGSADYDNVGRIDLYPSAFINQEQLVKTILHERFHVRQLQRYGKLYVQENLVDMERKAYRAERLYYNILKQKVK